MKWIVSSDHAGVDIKNAVSAHLQGKSFEVLSVGASSANASVDFPDVADEAISHFEENDIIILICGTGLGVSMRANRYPFLRAAVVYNSFVAEAAKTHNNANVLCFGARTQSIENISEYIDIFNASTYESGRHIARLEKLSAPCVDVKKTINKGE